MNPNSMLSRTTAACIKFSISRAQCHRTKLLPFRSWIPEGSLLQSPQRQYQQQRSMVMITKTSPSDLSLPPVEPAPESGNSDAGSLGTGELLTVTPSCVKQIHALLKRRNKTADEMFLRVYVDAGGCSGFTYKFELDDEFIEEEDRVFEPPGADGARVVVDESSLRLIQGSKIDYMQEMIKSSFVVNENPQSESACGCGSSFAVKNFSANPALD